MYRKEKAIVFVPAGSARSSIHTPLLLVTVMHRPLIVVMSFIIIIITSLRHSVKL